MLSERETPTNITNLVLTTRAFTYKHTHDSFNRNNKHNYKLYTVYN